jgi:general transcription factor 3C protein 4
MILVLSKAGVIQLWRSASSPFPTWSGLRTLPIDRAPTLSAGMSPFHPVAGIHHVRRRDVLIVCLSDGSFHVVHSLASNPSWTAPAPDDAVSTESLSIAARSIFTRVEPGTVDPGLVNRISGMASYDGSATVAWVHECLCFYFSRRALTFFCRACRPTDFSYKHDAKHNSVFLVARLWDDDDDEVLLQNLFDLLHSCRFGQLLFLNLNRGPDTDPASGLSPAHLLRPIFFKLHPRKLNQLHDRVLAILKPDFPDHSTGIKIAPSTGALTHELRNEFRGSLARHLFGYDVMLSLRMRLSLADFAWVRSVTSPPSKKR